MKNQSIEIAKTIQALLVEMDRTTVWSWGTHAWTVIENGLAFKVQGFKFKGVVKIVLDLGMDLYNIQLVKGNNIVESFEGIYFDELLSLIDNRVEYTGVNYANDVNKAYNLKSK